MIAGCWLLALANAFVLDDAFISFRYARNLVETGELTWNPGEAVPVEGYSNFLWTLMLAGTLTLGLEPVVASQALGLTAFLGSLLVTYRLALDILDSTNRATVAVGLLGTNYTFSCYATGGLETQLQALLIVAGCWTAKTVADSERGLRGFVLLSTLAALAALTRLDSFLPFGVLFTWCWIQRFRRRPSVGRGGLMLAASALPALFLIAPWLVWKMGYYGDVLPNTYYAKVLPSSGEMLRNGLVFCLNFVTSYQLLPLVVLALAKARSLWRHDLLACALLVLSWFGYVARVGGGFMEFRMLVPVLPALFVVLTHLIFQLPRRSAALLVAFVVFGSGFHAKNFNVTGEVETIAWLRYHLEPEGEAWPLIGKTLGRLFDDEHGEGEPVMIAVNAAGAVPYYSGLPTIDTLALNDLWLAREAPAKGVRPGHTKFAGFEYLIRRGVQLVIGHPDPRPLIEAGGRDSPVLLKHLAHYALVDVPSLPAGARLVQIPIDDSRGITVVYLVSHPRVEEVMARDGWVTWPIVAEH